MVMRHAIIADGVVTNIAVADADFAAEQGWVAIPDDLPVAAGWTYSEGSFYAPLPAPVPVPEVVSMRQARLALHATGLLDDVEAAIITMDEPSRTTAQIAWEYSTEVRRDDLLVTQLAGALGLSDEQVDELFRQAAGF